MQVDHAGLCIGCRELADKLALQYPNPDNFKLHIGCLAAKNGHKFIHEELIRLYKITFDEMPLDKYFNNSMLAQA